MEILWTTANYSKYKEDFRMEMQVLLKKTRELHQLLQKSAASQVDLQDMTTELAKIMEARVYVFDKKSNEVIEDKAMLNIEPLLYPEEMEDSKTIGEIQDSLAKYTETESNLRLPGREMICLLAPVQGTNERVATIIYAREKDKFDVNEIILAEYGANVAAMQIKRNQDQKLEMEARKKTVVQMALEVLSYSELEAVKYIFTEIKGNEGFLVASKLAEQYRLTRSVIVNALRKLESAGVIDARSLGMKGTYIKVLNDCLYQELALI